VNRRALLLPLLTILFMNPVFCVVVLPINLFRLNHSSESSLSRCPRFFFGFVEKPFVAFNAAPRHKLLPALALCRLRRQLKLLHIFQPASAAGHSRTFKVSLLLTTRLFYFITFIFLLQTPPIICTGTELNSPLWPDSVVVCDPSTPSITRAAVDTAFSYNGGHSRPFHSQWSNNSYAFLLKPSAQTLTRSCRCTCC
jgi:hypothetical protein